MSIILSLLAYLVFAHFFCDMLMPYVSHMMRGEDLDFFNDHYWWMFWLVPICFIIGVLISLFSNKNQE